MKIYGFQGTTLIDYPGFIASIIFTGGCNFHCPYCQNYILARDFSTLEEIPVGYVIDECKKRKGFIDGVVITGGEPTIYPDITEFCQIIKSIGLLVKLDTNGSNPDVIKNLISSSSIDYIAMDVKTSLEKYNLITKDGNFSSLVKESIKLIKSGSIDYEFRITVVPGIVDEKDILNIGEELNGCKRIFLQQFHPENCHDESFKNVEPFDLEVLRKMQNLISKAGVEVLLREG